MNENLPNIILKPIKRISPSRYINLQSCNLKGILSANNFSNLLPNYPSAYLGITIHKLIELALKGRIRDNKEISQEWDKIVNAIENDMLKNKLEAHLVPLELNARNFEVKKITAFNMVRHIIEDKDKNYEKSNIESEKWLEAADGKLCGKIDLIKKNNEYIEIIDLKTGNIFDNNLDVQEPKKEYQLQLKIYAALYFSNYKIWPKKLLIVDPNGRSYNIPFTPHECMNIFNMTKDSLKKINKLITDGKTPEFFANPSSDTCKFCYYRPICSKYWDIYPNTSDWPNDICGIVKEITRLGNGTFRVIITDNSKEISIRGLSDRHGLTCPDITKIMFCNLREDTIINHYIETPLTTSYLIND